MAIYEAYINTIFDFIAPYKVQMLVVFMYFFIKNNELKFVLFLMLFSSLLCAVIKSYLAIPPATEGLRGYSFPSGHVYICSILYVWLFINLKDLFLRFFIFFILFAGSYLEVIYNYHYTIDVICAVLLSIITWHIYYNFLKNYSDIFKIITITFATMLAGIVIILMKYDLYIVTGYPFTIFYKALGFAVGELLFNKYIINNKKLFILTSLGVVSALTQNSNSFILNKFNWVFIFALIPFVKALIMLIVNRMSITKTSTNRGVAFSVEFTASN